MPCMGPNYESAEGLAKAVFSEIKGILEEKYFIDLPTTGWRKEYSKKCWDNLQKSINEIFEEDVTQGF